MTRRRRLYTPSADKKKDKGYRQDYYDGEVTTARSRLKGALKDVLDPSDDSSVENSPEKRSQSVRRDLNLALNQEIVVSKRKGRISLVLAETLREPKPGQKMPFVMKLFDRNVDLAQFSEDTPLYPICRAWIANQPKANYKELAAKSDKLEEDGFMEGEGVVLPPPQGPPVCKIPDLLQEQMEACRNNVNYHMRNQVDKSCQQLMSEHISRWISIRRKWLDQGARHEARYANTHEILNQINTNF